MAHGGRWGRIGGHVVLDLVDSQSWRFDDARRVDRMPDVAALIEWATDRGLITLPAAAALTQQHRGDGRPGTAALRQVRALRAAMTGVLDAKIAGERPDARQLQWLRRRFEEALSMADVAAELPLSWNIEPASLAQLAHLVALRCGDFLRRDHPGLRCCEAPGCGWLFLDTSRNHSRRWCAPQDCGNRVRVARHTRLGRPQT